MPSSLTVHDLHHLKQGTPYNLCKSVRSLDCSQTYSEFIFQEDILLVVYLFLSVSLFRRRISFRCLQIEANFLG